MNKKRLLGLLLFLLFLILPAHSSVANAASLQKATDSHQNVPLTIHAAQGTSCDAHMRQGIDSYRQGGYDSAIEAFQSALRCYREASQRAGEGAALNNLGLIYKGQGHYDKALQQYEAALEIARELGNRANEGTALNNIGGIYHAQGHYEEALTHYEAALVIRHEVGDRAGEGTTLNSIGGLYRFQGRYREALAAYEAALAIRREVGDRAGEGITLHNIGALYRVQGQYDKALPYYAAALAIARERGDRAEEATTLNNIGLVYHAQGLYKEALAQFEAALTIRRDIGARASEGTTLNNIGLVYRAQGRYKDALAHYETALVIAREVGNRTGEGTTLNNIGTLYHAQGRYSDALTHYETALLIAREVGDRAEEAISLNSIGAVYHHQGRYGDALAYYEAALIIRRALSDLVGEGTTLNNIGALYGDQGRYEEQLVNYKAALTIIRETGNRASEGTILNNIGLLYDNQERYAEALAHYEAALKLRREVGDRAGEGATLNSIGRVYDNQGRYGEALAHYEAALIIRREVGDRAGEGITLNNIGMVYLTHGQYGQALQHLEAALLILREVGDRAGEGTILSNIGRVYADQTEYVDALERYRLALSIFEGLRAVAGSEIARAGFIAQHIDLYDLIIELHIRQNQIADALLTNERGRARSFLDSLSTGQVELFDNAAADLLARENEAYAVRQSAQDALARAKALTTPDSDLVADLEEQLAAAETAYAATLAAIQARQDQLADLVPGRNNRILSLAATQKQLDEQTTFVSYWMLDDKTIAFILTADTFTAVELPDATTAQISAAIQNLYQWRNRENAHPLPLRNLYHWLVEPLAEHLQTPHIAIVPHQLLHYVPFAALTDGETYFGQTYTLSLLPSASVLPFLHENARNGQFTGTPTAVVFGNPQTALAALPYAEAEAQAVADLIGATAYTSTQASELHLRAVVSGTTILHLAAHGDYNLANPLYSAITLAADDQQDGLLETHEIFGLPLKGNSLVVLSACQTSLNELTETSAVAVSRGDEIVGLTRAFFFAGAPTVISSLWSVNDAATEALMVSFYRHWLQEGMSKAAALQAAQADVRTDQRWAAPFYWAGFVLNGDPD